MAMNGISPMRSAAGEGVFIPGYHITVLEMDRAIWFERRRHPAVVAPGGDPNRRYIEAMVDISGHFDARHPVRTTATWPRANPERFR